MGSFAVRCAVSGLPIEFEDPRTPVRALLLVENPWAKMEPYGITASPPWIPRTFPLRAVCDGSGGIEQVQEGPERDVWLEGLNEDLIERPGDDRCPALRAGLSFDDLLINLADGRVFVRCVDRFAKSMQVLNDRLRSLGAPEFSAPAPETPNPRATSDDGFPNQRPFPKEGPLAVSLALIREDVWQTVRLLPVNRGHPAHQKLPNGGGELIGPGTHVDLLRERGALTPAFLNLVKEFLFVSRVMGLCGREWLPSSGRSNQQGGMWQTQAIFQRAITGVAKNIADRKRPDVYD